MSSPTNNTAVALGIGALVCGAALLHAHSAKKANGGELPDLGRLAGGFGDALRSSACFVLDVIDELRTPETPHPAPATPE